jgi:shikimate dehydrogenase
MKKFGLLGYNIGYSLSPAIHPLIYGFFGVKAEYSLVSVSPENLPQKIGELKKLDGFNVTQPHKYNIVKFLDSASGEYEAVNTVKNSGGKLSGCNTDAVGFSRHIQSEYDFSAQKKGEAALVLGAGGMAEIAARELIKLGLTVDIVNRTPEKAAALAAKVGARFLPDSQRLPHKVIVNCSSAELAGGDAALYGDINFSQTALAYDAIYRRTEFLKAAQKAGAKTVNGLGMLILQAIAAVTLWFDIKSDDEAVKKCYNVVYNGLKSEVK